MTDARGVLSSPWRRALFVAACLALWFWTQALIARRPFPAVLVVGMDDRDHVEDGRRARGGLQAEAVHAGDGAQVLFEPVQDLQGALEGLRVLQRVQPRTRIWPISGRAGGRLRSMAGGRADRPSPTAAAMPGSTGATTRPRSPARCSWKISSSSHLA